MNSDSLFDDPQFFVGLRPEAPKLVDNFVEKIGLADSKQGPLAFLKVLHKI